MQVAANSDPFDVEAQKRIEDAIRQENIAANLEAAMEYNPESFARVNIKKNENYFYLRKKRLIECIIRLLDYISMLKSMVANLLHQLIQVHKVPSVSIYRYLFFSSYEWIDIYPYQ